MSAEAAASAVQPKRTLLLVDASIYVFRSYYASPPEFFDVDGAPVHAVHGFLGFLLALLDQTSDAEHMLIAFDASLTTSFRNRIYPAYKANRELPPPDLDRQFDYCRELVNALGLTGLADCNYEADDLIGSAAAALRGEGFRSLIVSGDKDLTQLIEPGDEFWDYARRERVGADGVFAKLGVAPSQVADLLALTGDAVDNIPGVPGIGPKTAAPLLAHFGSLDALYARLDEVEWLRICGAAATATRLRTHRDQAYLSRQLTGIACDAPVPQDVEAYRRRPADIGTVEALLDRLRFGPLTRRRVRERFEKRDRSAPGNGAGASDS